MTNYICLYKSGPLSVKLPVTLELLSQTDCSLVLALFSVMMPLRANSSLSYIQLTDRDVVCLVTSSGQDGRIHLDK